MKSAAVQEKEKVAKRVSPFCTVALNWKTAGSSAFFSAFSATLISTSCVSCGLTTAKYFALPMLCTVSVCVEKNCDALMASTTIFSVSTPGSTGNPGKWALKTGASGWRRQR